MFSTEYSSKNPKFEDVEDLKNTTAQVHPEAKEFLEVIPTLENSQE